MYVVNTMLPVAADDTKVTWSVCVLDTWVSSAKTAEPIEMPFDRLTHV